MRYGKRDIEREREEKQQEMRRLQRKLIPVNLIVCLLCIVAIISMLCTPFITIDMGKITADENVDNYVRRLVQEQIDNMSGSGSESENTREGGSTGSFHLNDEAMTVIVSAIVEPVFGSVEASVSLTPQAIYSIAFSEHPGAQTTDLLIVGENGLIVQVADSLAHSVRNLGGNRNVTKVLQEAVVDLVADEIVNRLPADYGNIVTENKELFKEAINGLDEAKTEDEAVEKIMGFIENVDLTTSEGGTVADLTDEQRAQIENTVRDMYQTTVAETGDENGDNFSVEGLICVMASDTINKATDGGGFAELLKQMLSDGSSTPPAGEETAAVKKVLTEGEIEGEPSGSTTEGGETTEGNETGNETGETATEGAVYTTYQELFSSLITEEDAQEISDLLVEMVRGYLVDTEKAIDDMQPAIMAAFWSLVGFTALWGVLFLFSFIHLLTKNKRFTMWYVKLFAPYPAIIFWLLPLIAPYIFPRFLTGDALILATAVATGVSSLMWISGLCYLLLWAVSIFWAFPIKRKIRALNKELKYAY